MFRKKPLSKPVEELKPVKKLVEEVLSEGTPENLCECGKPVALGQSQVCKDHIRSR
jgi:hypothetical protein